MAREHLVRSRAYAIWESEGRPDGRDVEHWMRASQELDALKHDIDPASSADSILTLLGSLHIETMPPEERMAVSTVQLEALDNWVAASLDPRT